MSATIKIPTGLSKYFALFLVLLPILDIYSTGIPGVSIGKFIILLIIVGGFIFKGWRSLRYPKGYLPYFFYMLIVPQLIALITGLAAPVDMIYKSIGSLFFALCLGFVVTYSKLSDIVSIYKKVVIVCSIFFLIQEVAYFTLGYRIVGIITSLPLNLSGELISSDHMRILLYHSRSSSFFLEPAHFAQFLSLYLILSLIADRKEFLNFPSIFISVILILLRSGNGYFVLILVWTVWIVICLWQRRHFFPAIATIVLIAIAVPYVFNRDNEAISDVVERVEEISSEEMTYSSGFIRLYRGYFLYAELSTLEKIFGIGQGNLLQYLKGKMDSSYARLANYNIKDMQYINGIQQNLVFGGIIGFILFIIFLWKLFRKNTAAGKTIILTILLLYSISSAYNSVNILLMIIVASLLQKQNVAQKTTRQISPPYRSEPLPQKQVSMNPE